MLDSERTLAINRSDDLIGGERVAVNPEHIKAYLDGVIDGLPLVSGRFKSEVVILTLVSKGKDPLLGSLRRLGDQAIVEWPAEERGV